MLRNSFFAFIVLIFFSSCKDDAKHEKDKLIDFVKEEDNGLSLTKEINGVKINLTYRPTDLMVYQEISNSEISSSKKDSIKKKYKDNLYFVLSYSRDNKELLSTITESREMFNLVQNTLTFGMKDMVSLTNEKKDSISLIDYNFPRTYGMSRTTSLLFVFSRDQNLENSKTVNFNVQDIGIGIGDISFKYPIDIIKND